MFACFLDSFEYGVVPVLRVVDEDYGFGFGSSDVVGCLFGYVLGCFFVEWHGGFVLAQRIDLVQFAGNDAKGCSVEAHVGFCCFMFELFSDLFVFVGFAVGFCLGLGYE